MSLEQLSIIERLDAARRACDELQEMVRDRLASSWLEGRREGRADAEAHAAWVAITHLRSTLVLAMEFPEPVYGEPEELEPVGIGSCADAEDEAFRELEERQVLTFPRLRAIVKPEPPETAA